jgi:drug/metabolite transporter (DMT)-like permease
MNQLSNKVQGIIYIGLCIFLWSLIPVFAKFAQTSLDHYQYLFFSSVISFFSLLSVSIYNKKTNELFSYSVKTLIALFLLGFLDFFYYLLLYFGYKEANGLEVLVIQYTWPIFIVLLSLVLLNESLNKNKITSLILGFIAVFLIITKGDISSIDFTNIKVIMYVIIGSFAFALFSVLSKKIKVNLTNAITIFFLTAIIYSYISMSVFSSFVWPSSQEWIYILINGIFLNGISYLFWIKALQKADASFIAPFIFITPILSSIFLILFFDETIYMIYFFALFLIILSGIVNSLKVKRN